jgi:hypothetical protein
MNKNIAVLLLAVVVRTAPAWTKNAAVYATNGSQVDVAAAVANASAGDTVRVPAGSFTWGDGGRTAVSLDKAITLRGAGPEATTIVLSESGPTYGTGTISLSAAATARDFSIRGSSGAATAFACYSANGWRVTDIHFDGGAGNGYFLYAGSYGLIDNCSITGSNGSAEFVFTRGPTDSWQTPSSMGTADAVYIEDCTYDGQGYVSDANSNSRMVVRYCTIKGSNKVDAHGVASNSPPRSCRHIEVYDNSWTDTSGYFADLEIRGGTGMLFDNTDQNPQGGWFFLTEYGYLAKWPNFGNIYQTPANYPVADQIGVGEDPKVGGSEPLYSWNNARLGAPWARTIRAVDAGAITAYGKDFSESDVIAPDRDYFWSAESFDGSTGIGRGTKTQMRSISPTKKGVGFWVTDEGVWNSTHSGFDRQLYAWSGTSWVLKYTPYTYPHPLRESGSAGIVRRSSSRATGNAIARLDRSNLVLRLGFATEAEVSLFSLSGQRLGGPLRGSYPAGTTTVPLGFALPRGSVLVRIVAGPDVSVQRAVVE